MKIHFETNNNNNKNNPESLVGNAGHKLLWDFEIQIDHLISARQPDPEMVNKNKSTSWNVDFAVLADYIVKLKERVKKDKYLELARESKKLGNMKVTVIPIAIGALGTVTKELVKGTGGLGNKRMSGDHPNYSIKINQNTEKCPGDLSGLTVTQIPARNHWLMLVWKTFKGVKNYESNNNDNIVRP